jgi:hypothetical protein
MSEKVLLTEKNVTEAFRQIIEDFGADYVYRKRGAADSCFYVHQTPKGEVPGCIVGQLLHRLGVPLEVLKKREGRSAWAIFYGRELLGDGEAESPVRAEGDDLTRKIQRVQSAQDRGDPWGYAVRNSGFEV